MLFTESVFVGVDPASSHKAFTYAALDKGLNLVALSDGELDDVAAFLAGQSHVVVAVNSPSGLNRGLVREKKKELFHSLKTRASGFRMAEAELRERGITVTGTPSLLANCPAWMQSGFSLYRVLARSGFKNYPAENASLQILETQPLACYFALAGAALPLARQSLEGRLQRQLLLYEAGLRIKDPMEFFEEITRYKMLKGNWPLELLYSAEQADALVAAYTAWLAFHKPETVISLGDKKEGLIFMPAINVRENR